MKAVHRHVLQGIGKTPLMALRNIVPENGSRVVLKLEALNPTGSMKDRMALRLAREEGLLAGTSTGGPLIAALRLADQPGPEATIVTVMCDTGMKYLSTD